MGYVRTYLPTHSPPSIKRKEGRVCEKKRLRDVVSKETGNRKVSNHRDFDFDLGWPVRKWGEKQMWGPEGQLSKYCLQTNRPGRLRKANLQAAPGAHGILSSGLD